MKTAKTTPKKSSKARVKQYIARPLAYMSLITSATYGIRQMLIALQDSVSFAITILLVLALVYILFDTEK